MRLWDIRKMRSHQEYEEVKNVEYGIHGFDYRFVGMLPVSKLGILKESVQLRRSAGTEEAGAPERL